ncbi:MAG: VWA domain-containing protein [Paludibacteraceae bacterium]|nr:VWA domain-containing protein [Paludibacteraceae bacterium]
MTQKEDTNRLDNSLAINRWRLVLGSMSDQSLSFSGSEREVRTFEEMEQLLDYLYNHAQGGDVREDGTSERCGGLGGSQLTAAKWITKVRELFPKQTSEVLERHALDEFKMTELLTDKKILEQMKPDMSLLKTILQLKHLMKGEVLETAKKLARAVAEELSKKLAQNTKQALTGRLDRSSRSPIHSARNIDINKTIQRNLKNYDKENETLVLKDVYFSGRVKKYNKKTVIIAVDESGSMLGSVIYSAVMAQIISQLPFAEIKLVIFDTQVVDLSGMAEDPAEVMMSIQLGGGTEIGKALVYCESLIREPSNTCVLCVTDLYEGGSPKLLLNTAQNILTSGAKLSFLTALDECANPAYDKNLGQLLADTGAFVGAMTPDKLGDYIGSILS